MNKLKILPENIIRKFGSSAALKKLLAHSPVAIVYPCGGSATCGKCRVQFISGAPQPSYADLVYFNESELQKGYRLACDTVLSADAQVLIPEESLVRRQVILTSHTAYSYPARLRPKVEQYVVAVQQPTVQSRQVEGQVR